MSLPFSLPDWVPWWVPIAVLVPVLLYALVFLCMPFSVIGLRGRLESIEARLDDIQADLRALALRLPEPLRAGEYDEPPLLRRAPPRAEPPPSGRPPIPPAPHYPDARPPTAGPARPRQPEPRAEPRLDWPR